MTEIYVPLAGKPKMYILDLAFDDIGLSSGEFERTADEYAQALRKLNALMMETPFNKLGYAQPIDGDGQPEEKSNLPDDTIQAVSMRLALRLAPAYGKVFGLEFRQAAARSFETLTAQYSTIASQSVPLHKGAGWSRYHY